MRKTVIALLSSAVLVCAAQGANAAHRASVSSATAVTHFHDLTFHQATLAFPVAHARGWTPDVWVAGVGTLRRNGEESTLLSFGPAWRWYDVAPGCRCFLDAGISVAYLDQARFHNPFDLDVEDFGRQTQFVSRVALGWSLDPADRWSVAVQFLHISNGGLSDVNPGADFLGLDVQFYY